MITETMVLQILGYKIPAHPIGYSWILRGLNRSDRRRAVSEIAICWAQYDRDLAYAMQARKLVDYIDFGVTPIDQLVDQFGGRLFVDPHGDLCIARPKANHDLLYKRGCLPFWYYDIVKRKRGPCWALPWPLKGRRKLSRWQGPPRSTKFLQAGGAVDNVSATNHFPVEWRPKDSFDIEGEHST